MEPCDCKDIINRCDEHKDLVIGVNLLTGDNGFFTPTDETTSQHAVENETYVGDFMDGLHIKETDSMGREIFWEEDNNV